MSPICFLKTSCWLNLWWHHPGLDALQTSASLIPGTFCTKDISPNQPAWDTFAQTAQLYKIYKPRFLRMETKSWLYLDSSVAFPNPFEIVVDWIWVNRLLQPSLQSASDLGWEVQTSDPYLIALLQYRMVPEVRVSNKRGGCYINNLCRGYIYIYVPVYIAENIDYKTLSPINTGSLEHDHVDL